MVQVQIIAPMSPTRAYSLCFIQARWTESVFLVLSMGEGVDKSLQAYPLDMDMDK